MTHTIDVLKDHLELLKNGSKSFIILKDDRNYIVGDTIAFQVLADRKELKMSISYLEVEVPGLKNGFIILGLKEITTD
jgi:hypothetical protein